MNQFVFQNPWRLGQTPCDGCSWLVGWPFSYFLSGEQIWALNPQFYSVEQVPTLHPGTGRVLLCLCLKSHIKSLWGGTKGGFILRDGDLKSKKQWEEGARPQMGLFLGWIGDSSCYETPLLIRPCEIMENMTERVLSFLLCGLQPPIWEKTKRLGCMRENIAGWVGQTGSWWGKVEYWCKGDFQEMWVFF